MTWLKDAIDSARHNEMIGRPPIHERILWMSRQAFLRLQEDPEAYCTRYGWGRYESHWHLGDVDQGVDVLIRTWP